MRNERSIKVGDRKQASPCWRAYHLVIEIATTLPKDQHGQSAEHERPGSRFRHDFQVAVIEVQNGIDIGVVAGQQRDAVGSVLIDRDRGEVRAVDAVDSTATGVAVGRDTDDETVAVDGVEPRWRRSRSW